MSDDRSFAAAVKEELAQVLSSDPANQKMELAALLRASGRIALVGGGQFALSLTTDWGPVARKMVKMIRAHYQVEVSVLVTRKRNLRKNLTYVLRMGAQPDLEPMLRELGVTNAGANLVDWAELPGFAQEGGRRAYLRGYFLGTGWIAAPERQHHLELAVHGMEAADALGQILFQHGIPVRLSYRRESHLLYLKEAEQIGRFLALVGAHDAYLRYEDVRVVKEMKNLVNRQVNAETANLSKTVEASARQVELFQHLKRTGEVARLSPALVELIDLRLKHPDASLKELGELCQPPVGKSGINHRMRQLMRICESMEP
ncbi:MAG TPA: DNA-binding protein WhiA [Symbiobacteriaceae bacterium]|nr:DNA-binding protein WhiA [Symbiobacteriaceae bacterium]